MERRIKFIGLDVHKETIAVAVAEDGADREVRFHGTIASTAEAVRRLVARLAGPEIELCFCYEAGPFGLGLYRQLRKLGAECLVIAPSTMPRRPGDRVKTDRRDAVTMARLLRAGELAGIWIPDEEHGNRPLKARGVLLGWLGGAPFSVGAVEADELAQVLEAEVSEGWRVLVVEAVDGQHAALGLELEADLVQPVLVLAEQGCDAGQREDVANCGHAQAARASGPALGCQFHGKSSSSRVIRWSLMRASRSAR
jgi:hypothetical protein